MQLIVVNKNQNQRIIAVKKRNFSYNVNIRIQLRSICNLVADYSMFERGLYMNIAEILGKNLLALRKEKGWTQDEVAEKLGISAQAVSKWENGVSCPDITLLPGLSDLYGVLVDDLLRDEEERRKRQGAVMAYVPEEKRKKPEEMLFRILVDSQGGDKVRINLPLPLLKAGMDLGIASSFTGKDALKDIDLEQVFRLAENGVLGKLVEVESADGDHVEIVVE